MHICTKYEQKSKIIYLGFKGEVNNFGTRHSDTCPNACTLYVPNIMYVGLLIYKLILEKYIEQKSNSLTLDSKVKVTVTLF